eukprot:Em0007g115a
MPELLELLSDDEDPLCLPGAVVRLFGSGLLCVGCNRVRFLLNRNTLNPAWLHYARVGSGISFTERWSCVLQHLVTSQLFLGTAPMFRWNHRMGSPIMGVRRGVSYPDPNVRNGDHRLQYDIT